MRQTAARAALTTLVVLGIVVLALALWKLRLVVALLFLAFILAAAMRPTVERMAARGIPRAAGIGIHYAAFVALVATFLWAVVPRAIQQVEAAIGNLPATSSDLGEHGTGAGRTGRGPGGPAAARSAPSGCRAPAGAGTRTGSGPASPDARAARADRWIQAQAREAAPEGGFAAREALATGRARVRLCASGRR